MEDRYSKYIQLTFNLFFTFIVFVLALLLVMLGLKYMFRLLDYIPWFVYVYALFIIIVPPALFISIFLIYFRRTATHPSKPVIIISKIIFIIALVAWGTAFILDIVHFIKTGSREISTYYGYNIFLLVASVGLIFLIGVLQALSTTKEKDWMEKRREKELGNEDSYQ